MRRHESNYDIEESASLDLESVPGPVAGPGPGGRKMSWLAQTSGSDSLQVSAKSPSNSRPTSPMRMPSARSTDGGRSTSVRSTGSARSSPGPAGDVFGRLPLPKIRGPGSSQGSRPATPEQLRTPSPANTPGYEGGSPSDPFQITSPRPERSTSKADAPPVFDITSPRPLRSAGSAKQRERRDSAPPIPPILGGAKINRQMMGMMPPLAARGQQSENKMMEELNKRILAMSEERSRLLDQVNELQNKLLKQAMDEPSETCGTDQSPAGSGSGSGSGASRPRLSTNEFAAAVDKLRQENKALRDELKTMRKQNQHLRRNINETEVSRSHEKLSMGSSSASLVPADASATDQLTSHYKKLLMVNVQINQQTEMDKVIDTIVDGGYTTLNAIRVSLFIVDRATNSLWCKVSKDKEELSVIRIPLGQGIAGYVAKTGTLVNIPNAYKDDRFDTSVDKMTGFTTRSILAVPVLDQQHEIIAVLQALNKQDDLGYFDQNDEELMSFMAAQAGICLRKAQMYVQLMTEKVRTETLLQVVRTVSLERDAEQVIKKIAELTYDALYCDRVTFFLLDEVKNELWCKVSKDKDSLGIIRIPVGQGVAGYVALTGQTLNIPNAYEDPRFDPSVDQKTGYRTNSILCMPICDTDGTPVAVVQCLNRSGGPFTQADEDLLAAFSSEIATAIRRSFLETAVSKMSAENDDNAKVVVRGMLSEYFRQANRRPSGLEADAEYAAQFRIDKLKSTKREQILKTWGFDALQYTPEQLMVFVADILDQLNLIERFSIPEDRLRQFLMRVHKGYRNNPFHNFEHAFQVFHVAYMILVTTNLQSLLTQLDALGLLLAALCHDLDHRGVNNAFEIASRSPLALLYNDNSVLENHHAHQCFEILGQPECNILCNLDQSKNEFSVIRKNMIAAILSTDMAQHQQLLSKLQSRSRSFSADSAEDRSFLVCLTLHTADLSNSVLSEQSSISWAHRVMDEFNLQAQKERSAGMTVSAFMEQREKKERAKLQLNFIDYIVHPLWKGVAEVLSNLSEPMSNLKSNRDSWKRMSRGEGV